LVFKDSWDVQDEKWSVIREKSRNSFPVSMIGQTGPWLLDK
jgi:hypothetical protein